LHIVAAVSSDWGVRRVPGGKAVWFTLTLPDVDAIDADVFNLRERPDHPADDDRAESTEQRELQARAAR
jgi:hypothetical protein